MKGKGLFMVAAALGLMTSRASADEHHTRVNEIFLSDPLDGDAVQFIELVDPVEEPFPEDTYHLGIYDTHGALLAAVPVDIPPGTNRYLVATAAAEDMFEVQADALLSATLPAEGQACFEVTEEGENAVIACLAYGCVDQVVDAEFANETGMAPFEGKSIQRQADHTFEVADPTPDAVNVSGVAGEPDCTPPDDDMDEPPPDDDGGGCQVVTQGSQGGLALVGLGLLALRRRRRRH